MCQFVVVPTCTDKLTTKKLTEPTSNMFLNRTIPLPAPIIVSSDFLVELHAFIETDYC